MEQASPAAPPGALTPTHNDMKDRSVIIYARTTEPGPAEVQDYVKAPGPVWIRTEVVNKTVFEIVANDPPPREGEVRNILALALPPEPRFRLLEPGEIIHERDSWTENDGDSWHPIHEVHWGKAWTFLEHYPTRRQLASWEDAY